MAHEEQTGDAQRADVETTGATDGASTATTAPQRADAARSWWDSAPGRRLALGITLACAAVVLLMSLGRTGVWEPWEMYPLEVAQEYATRPPAPPEAELAPTAPSYNWAVPTYEGRPVAVSLLATWLIARGLPAAGTPITALVGRLELTSRLPIALMMLLLVVAVFFWVRRYFGALPAWLSGVGLVSLPIVHTGVVSLATPLLGVATTALAVLAFAPLLFAATPRQRWASAAGLGVAMSLAFLDLRFWGLLLPLTVFTTLGLTQLAYEPDARPHRAALGLAVATLAAPLLRLLILFGGGVDEGLAFLSRPHIRQLYTVIFPACVLGAGLLASHRTRVGRALLQPTSALALGLPAVVAFATLHGYADANPTLLRHGVITGKIPALTFALEHHLFTPSLASKHVHFDYWLRQLGFATFPLTALIPLGLGYLARASRRASTPDPSTNSTDGAHDPNTPGQVLQRMLLLWAVMGLPVVALASAHQHWLYTAYVPLVISVGLLFADRDFWAKARLRPMLLYTMGFAAIAVVMMLGKDLERFPSRFFELYLALEEKPRLPEDFTFGRLHKLFKYAWMLSMATFFYGLVSWGFMTLDELRGLPDAWKRWRSGERGAPVSDAPEDSPLLVRAQQKEALRAEDSLRGRLATLAETPKVMGPALLLLGVANALVFQLRFVPEASVHLSQRHIFQTYLKHAKPGEQLVRYQTSSSSKSFYLNDVPRVNSAHGFVQQYGGASRMFAVVPRDRLPAVNAEVRRKNLGNVPVLNARSNRLVLISNKLREGERDESFITRAIVKDPSEIQHHLKVKRADGTQGGPLLDRQLELVGYSFNKPGAVPAFAWREKMKLSLYFRVLKRVPTRKKIFLHIDTHGNRIHGDHYPIGDAFPTNYWTPGDIIRDTHELEIGSYTKQGVYTIFMGMFQGSRRMKITPRSAQDGGDRIRVGKLRVKVR